MERTEEQIVIPKKAAICASLHITELQKAAVANRPVDFGFPCEACPYPYRGECKFDWFDVLWPILQHCERSCNVFGASRELPPWPQPMPEDLEYYEKFIEKKD